MGLSRRARRTQVQQATTCLTSIVNGVIPPEFVTACQPRVSWDCGAMMTKRYLSASACGRENYETTSLHAVGRRRLWRMHLHWPVWYFGGSSALLSSLSRKDETIKPKQSC